MYRTENALILREVRFREADRILTALTADRGKLTLTAHGALGKRSKMTAATQQLTWSELSIFEKNGRYSVREGVVKEAFQGLRKDLGKLALGSFFSECMELFAAEDQPEPELTQLGLNCLYALSEGLAEPRKIKCVFELRLMSIEGYAPAVESCSVCGREDVQEPLFLTEEGQIVCRNCRKQGWSLPLTKSALAVFRYIMQAPAKRLLSSRLPDADLDKLAAVSEAWLLKCAGRSLPTLAYYKNIMSSE